MRSTSARRAQALVCALLLALAPVLHLAAQAADGTYAFVIYAEGFEMSIFRNGELTAYDVLVDDVLGMPLLPGDLVQTDADTYVEIQVMPSRTVVKVAENTTFEIERLGGEGGGTFNMTYGRLRARVDRITGNDAFEIRGFSAVAGVRGTDFGYDMVVEREVAQELQTRVYVFEGEVEVSEAEAASETDPASDSEGAPDGDGGASGAAPPPAELQRVTLRANEMVNVISEVPAALAEEADDLVDGERSPDDDAPAPTARPVAQNVVFRQQQVEEEISTFWREQDFVEEAVDPDAVEERFPGITARVERLSAERAQFEELQRLRREGLLSSPETFVAEAQAELEPIEPGREPTPVALGAPGSSERIRRLIIPTDAMSRRDQAILGGHWMVGLGIAVEAAGLLGAWFVEGYRQPQELLDGGFSSGLIAGGGVFITTGLISYLAGLLTPAD